MRLLRSALVPPLLALACSRGGEPRLPAPAAAPAPESERLRFIAADVARASATGAGPALVVASGVGGVGDTIGGRMDVPAEDCVLVLARGSPSVEDLDVFVYADDGAVLGADDKPTAGGSVLVCPPHPRHVYAFGRIAAGHGMLTVSAQLVRRADAERAANAVGAKGQLAPAPVLDQGWPGLDDALRAHRRALGANFRDVRRMAVPLDARLGTHVSVTTDSDECLDVFALPSNDVALVELTLLDADGRIVASSENEDRAPSIVVCAPAGYDLTLEIRPHAGRGMAALIIGANDDPNARKTIGGQLPIHEMVPAVLVDEAREKNANRLTRAGYSTGRLLGHGVAKVGERVVLPIDVPDGCSRVDVVGGVPARTLDAWLWTSSGTLVAHDSGTSGSVLFACGASQGARLDVEALAHGGPFVVEVRNLHGDFGLLAEKPLAASRLLGRLSASERIRTPKDAATAKRLKLDSTTLVTERTQVAVGTCLDAALALDVGAQGAELRLVDAETDTEVASARGTYSALAGVCALDRPRPLVLRIEMRVGAGAGDALIATLQRTATVVAPAASATKR